MATEWYIYKVGGKKTLSDTSKPYKMRKDTFGYAVPRCPQLYEKKPNVYAPNPQYFTYQMPGLVTGIAGLQKVTGTGKTGSMIFEKDVDPDNPNGKRYYFDATIKLTLRPVSSFNVYGSKAKEETMIFYHCCGVSGGASKSCEGKWVPNWYPSDGYMSSGDKDNRISEDKDSSSANTMSARDTADEVNESTISETSLFLTQTDPDTLEEMTAFRSSTLKQFDDKLEKARKTPFTITDVNNKKHKVDIEAEYAGGPIIKNSGTDTKTKLSSDIAHALRARGMVYEDRKAITAKFNRMQWANPYISLGPTREYLFFTKPDLHIMGKTTANTFKNPINKLNPELSGDPFWLEMKQRYRRLISCLQYSARRTSKDTNNQTYIQMDSGEFMRPLTNMVASSLELPDVSAETVDTPANIYGTTLQYKKSAMKSDEGYDFSLEFVDNPWLDIYHIFKMWNEYSNLKDLGMVTPPGPRNKNPYRTNKILHDQIGIFKFVVDEDGETILYYAYLTGCFPKSLPRSSFGSLNPGLITYSVDWHAQFVEDMNPMILLHFNMLIRKWAGLSSFNGDNYKEDLSEKGLNSKGYHYVPVYNTDRQEINGGWRDLPVISKVKDANLSTKSRYLLQWYDKK